VRIFRPKGREATEDWRKMHNNVLHNFQFSFLSVACTEWDSRMSRLMREIRHILSPHLVVHIRTKF
jgi:hypothetical protein